MTTDSGTYTFDTIARRLALAQELLAPRRQPIQHWAQGLDELAKGLVGGMHMRRAEGLEKEGNVALAKYMEGLIPGGGGDPATAPTRTPGIAASPMGTGITPAVKDITDAMISAESRGNPNAKNPRSSATGLGQFINSTWLSTLRKARPDLVEGRSPQELLAMRSDPALSREMTAAYAGENQGYLGQRGLPVTNGTTYLAHFAGPAGAEKILRAQPGTPIAAVLGPKVMAANPFLRGMTTTDIQRWADRKVAGAGPLPAPPNIPVSGTGAMPGGAPKGPPMALPEQLDPMSISDGVLPPLGGGPLDGGTLPSQFPPAPPTGQFSTESGYVLPVAPSPGQPTPPPASFASRFDAMPPGTTVGAGEPAIAAIAAALQPPQAVPAVGSQPSAGMVRMQPPAAPAGEPPVAPAAMPAVAPPGPPAAAMPMASPQGPSPAAMPNAAVPPQLARHVLAGLNSPYRQVREQAHALGQKLIAQQLENKPTDEMREYQLYKQQGGTKPFFDYKVDLKKASAPSTSVTVDQRAESEFNKKGGALQAERFNDIVKAGTDAQSMVADLQALQEIGSRVGTGKTQEVLAALGPYAEALGIKIEGLGDLQAYRSITAKLAPRMRPAGAGATSDYDARQYLEALPSLGRTPEGNAIIDSTTRALQEHRIAASDIASKAMAGEIKPQQAEKMLRELPDPYAMWKKNKGRSPADRPGFKILKVE